MEAHEAPRYEPWLGITSASCVPLLLSFVLPRTFLVPMLAISGILLAAGLTLLFRQGMHPERNSSS